MKCNSFHSHLLIGTLLVALVGGGTLSTAAQPGTVDTTFDPGRGALKIRPGEGAGVLIQPDGKIVVGGNFNGLGIMEVPPVVRFNSDGSLDETFDASALRAVNISLNRANELLPLALQPDGGILVAPAEFNNSYGSRALLRLDSNGRPDEAFHPQFGSSQTPKVNRATVLADGRILVSGSFSAINGISRRSLARLNPDGSVDQTFSPARVGSFRLLASGQLIVHSDTFYRLNSDGSLDTSFVADVPPVEGDSPVGPFLVQADARIVYSEQIDFFGTIVTRRLNADGSQDGSFRPFRAQFGAVRLLQSDGKLIVGGVRLNPDGSVDQSFEPDLVGVWVAQDSDGKLVTADRFYAAPYGIRRLLQDGSLDSTFAPEGGLTAILPGKIDFARLLPNGKVVIAGSFDYLGNLPRHRIAVLNRDGTPDETFDAGDLLVVPYREADLRGLFAQSDGKIFVSFEERLVRLHGDGTEDSTFRYTPAGKGVRGVVAEQGEKFLVHGPDGLVRVEQDGTRDPSFQAAASGGVLFVEPDGKIMMTGRERLATRLHPDGSIDSSFSGVGGLPTYDVVRAMARQPDGSYLVSRFDIGHTKTDLFFRVFNDGTRDPSFNANIASVRRIVVDASGITVAGDVGPYRAWGERGGGAMQGVARLNFDGSRDALFKQAQFDGNASASKLLLQPDGNLIIAGDFRKVDGVERNGIARLIGGAPKHLANISTRVRVGTGEAAAIGGFIVTGETAKKLIIRALGPSLGSSGLPSSELLADPTLTLHDGSSSVIATNNDWRAAEAEVNATGIPPTENSESAIVATLAPGSYTAVVHDAQGGGGIALVEIYDLNPAGESKVANISTRGSVAEGENVMIGGFILRGSEASTIVARALGSSLEAAGVINVLPDPALTVHDASGELVAANDNWTESQQAALETMELGCANESEAALIATLVPGAYTAVVRGKGDAGVGLVEIYNVEKASE